jgi:hypothetical protein
VAKKQRPSEGDTSFLAPESLPPSVALQEEPPLPTLYGLGITQKLTKRGWVAFRCSTAGEIVALTPKRGDGSLQGEQKHSAAARLMKAVAEEYA